MWYSGHFPENLVFLITVTRSPLWGSRVALANGERQAEKGEEPHAQPQRGAQAPALQFFEDKRKI